MTADIASQAHQQLTTHLNPDVTKVSLSRLSADELTSWLHTWLGSGLHLKQLHGFKDLSDCMSIVETCKSVTQREFHLSGIYSESDVANHNLTKTNALDELEGVDLAKILDLAMLRESGCEPVAFNSALLQTHIIPVLGNGNTFLPYDVRLERVYLSEVLGDSTQVHGKNREVDVVTSSRGRFLAIRRVGDGEDVLCEVSYATKLSTAHPMNSQQRQEFLRPVIHHQLIELEVSPLPIDSFAERFGDTAGTLAFYTLFSLLHAYRKTNKAAKQVAKDAQQRFDNWDTIVKSVWT